MIEALGRGTVLGYCGNVHPVRTFEDLLAVVRGPAREVRDRVGSNIGYGLWMPADLLMQITDDDTDRLRDAMGESGLVPYTFNAFPYGDFHGHLVKKRVYEPAWDDPRRAEFTLHAARLMARLVPEGGLCTVSTLPLGWAAEMTADRRAGCMERLRLLASDIADLAESTGRRCSVGLEPEPGCALERSADVEMLAHDFGEWPPTLGICHDVCHAAVMAESQWDAIELYADLGIPITKLHLSSSPLVTPDLWTSDPAVTSSTLEPLDSSRYLHQTYVRRHGGVIAYEDIGKASDDGRSGAWRIHYHVPISLARFGTLPTTRETISGAIHAARKAGCEHFEIETYTWPHEPNTARGISDEFLAVPLVAKRRSILATLARVFRIANLPTVWTNVIAGVTIAGGSTLGLVSSLVAGSLLYVGGMAFNDAWDAERDRWERPERPIPRDEITRSSTLMLSVFLLVSGVGLAGMAGAGWIACALAGSILAYTVLHQRTAAAAVFMALCRALLYALGAQAAGEEWSDPLVLTAAGLAAGHTAFITLLARDEAGRPGTRKLIPWLIAGFCLLDASIIFTLAPGWSGLVCAACFLLTIALQRVLPST